MKWKYLEEPKNENKSKQKISYFSAGPAKIPFEVKAKMQDEFLKYQNTDASILELSSSSQCFRETVSSMEKRIRKLLNVPSNYKIFCCYGGATGQFAAIPLNLISKTGKADYIVTGSWSSKAYKEAQKYGCVRLAGGSEKGPFYGAPDAKSLQFNADAAYAYYCANETIGGIEFNYIPEVPEGVALVCDMSSNILSRPFDVEKFGVVFASAQKNIGIAGATLVIVREDLIGNALSCCPTMFDYKALVEQEHPPMPVHATYVMGEMIRWIDEKGGTTETQKSSILKSSKIYDLIDKSENFFYNPVKKDSRSRMNVVFRIGGPQGDEKMEAEFLKRATEAGLLGLKGHRSVGGIRVSLYVSILVEDVERLLEMMQTFMEEKKAK